MSRMEINALLKVAAAAETGRYTLPAELTDALRTYDLLKATEPPHPQVFSVEQAAGRIVDAIAAGRSVDLDDMVVDSASSATQAQATEQVRTALSLAVDLAAETVTLRSADLTEKVITEHLAPAQTALLDEVRAVAVTLEGHPLSPHALLSAPAKVRNAYLTLPDLAARWQAIREARRLVNAIGHRQAQHDESDLFALFAKPMALRPGWKPPARIPQLDMPTEPTEFLLWLISPQAAPGEPWLPTIAEQDAAWWAQFGEGQQMREQAHRNGMAVGARMVAR